MSILTAEQLTSRKRAGWKVFQPGLALSYKSQWNTPWFFVREFYQNALDEHDEAGVSSPPTMTMGSKGLVIEDRGRGLGAEAMLLRETKSEQGGLRGRFGEGLKFACVSAVRQGYTPVIESSKGIIEAHGAPFALGGITENVLTFLFKPQARAREGTKVTIHGYKGDMYKERFAQFQNKPLLLVHEKDMGRFRRNFTLWKGEGWLYVGDIFIRDLAQERQGRRLSAPYNYNLWGVPLNPDRVSEVNWYDLRTALAAPWSKISNVKEAQMLIAAISKPDSIESQIAWYDYVPDGDLLITAFHQMYGKMAVLYTSDLHALLAEGYGFKVIGKGWSSSSLDLLKGCIDTDENVVEERIQELTKPEVIPDSRLTENQRRHLNVLRFLNENQVCAHNGEFVKVVAAKLPSDPRTEVTTIGFCSEGVVYITPGQLENEEKAYGIFFHEIGHWVGDARDLTKEHQDAIEKVAGVMAAWMRQYSVARRIDEILGKTPAPVAPPEIPGPAPVPPARPPVQVPPGALVFWLSWISGVKYFTTPTEAGEYEGEHRLRDTSIFCGTTEGRWIRKLNEKEAIAYNRGYDAGVRRRT